MATSYPTGVSLKAQRAFSEFNGKPSLLAKAQKALGIGTSSSTPKAVPNGTATGLFTLPLATGATIGGAIRYNYLATDGTDYQSLTGFVTYAGVNKAGTFTGQITELTTLQAKAVSAGTITLAWTITWAANVATIKLQPTTSLTATTANVTYVAQPLRQTITAL